MRSYRVGVFGDIRRLGLDDEDASWMLRPYSQAGWPFFSIVTRTASAPRSFEAPVNATCVDPVSALRHE